jgi:outer membrane protein assembly factor BamB
MAPVVADNVTTSAGARTVVYVAGSSDTFFALDAHDGKVLWNRTFDSAVLPEDESFYLCPNAVNATPTIDRASNLVYTIARDGKLYGLDLGSGQSKFGPFQLIPAFAKPWSLNFSNGIVYTSTSQGCGGDRSGIYSMDVTDPMHAIAQKLLIRKGYGGGAWTRGGVVIGPDNRLYVSTGDGGFDPAVGDYGSSFLAITRKASRSPIISHHRTGKTSTSTISTSHPAASSLSVTRILICSPAAEKKASFTC